MNQQWNLLDPEVFLDNEFRSHVIKQINNEENKERKRGSLKAFEVYKKRQEKFIILKLEEEFNKQSIKDMRKILSINMSRRIVNELASVYNSEPSRTYNTENEDERQRIEEMYALGQVNAKMKRANQYYRLANQCFMYVRPKDNIIDSKIYMPHHIDVVPDPRNPEKALAYVISVFSKFNYLQQVDAEDFENKGGFLREEPRTSNSNETIADNADYMDKVGHYIWWTEDYHFMTDAKGNIIDPDTMDVRGFNVSEDLNPIAPTLPFIDVAESDKDDEFFVREGYAITDFAIDMSAIISDITNTSRLQGYAQAVITAPQAPENLLVGPNHIIWLKQNPKQPEITPKFEFVTPSPDLDGSLKIIEFLFEMFLSQEGLDVKQIKNSVQYSSGFEKLLAMIDQMQATANDYIVFKNVEREYFSISKEWMNVMNEVSPNDEQALVEELRGGISEDTTMSIKFNKPESIQTEEEKETSVIRRLESGLMTKTEAIAELREMTLEEAEDVIGRMNEEMQAEFAPLVAPQQPDQVQPADQGDVAPINPQAEPEVPAALGDVEAQIRKDTSLNGAQVTSLLQVIENVTTGQLPFESAIEIIMVAFNLTREQVLSLLEPIRGFEPRGENQGDAEPGQPND